MDPQRRLQFVQDITERINQGLTVEDILGFIYDNLREFLPYNRIAVALVDGAGNRLSIVAGRSDGKMVLGRGYSGEVAGSSLEPLLREGRMRILNDLQEHLRQKPDSESTRLIVREGMRSSLTLPLQVAGRAVGAVFFSSREAGTYGPQHEEFLRGIAGQLAQAIERVRLIDELREKSDYLDDILRNAAEAILVVARDGRIRTWNEGARRMFGYPEEEILGRSMEILLPPGQEARDELERIAESVERHGFIRDYEAVRVTKDGRHLSVSITSSILRDKLGRPTGRSAILRDLTHVKRLQEELVRSQSLAAVGELAATVAHEVKNPLAGMSGAIQVLAGGFDEKDPRREVVKEILEQINRLDRTVRDLLSFSRPLTPSRREIAIGENLQRSWQLLSSQADAEAVRFELQGADGLRIEADPELLQQVWINLFQNAVEAMPGGGDLKVKVVDGPRVAIEVRDTGNGVAPAHAAKLFRPFFSTKTRGTGLGLAISRKILEAHGGSIRMESSPGRGTAVFVEIPK